MSLESGIGAHLCSEWYPELETTCRCVLGASGTAFDRHLWGLNHVTRGLGFFPDATQVSDAVSKHVSYAHGIASTPGHATLGSG